ncbi:MAG: aldehyde dehydrogenase [bacterium]
MAITREQNVNAVVGEVLKRLQRSGTPVNYSTGRIAGPVFNNAQQAIDASIVAQKQWAATPKETKKNVIAALRTVMRDHAEDFARRELQETGLGRYQDKIYKIHNAAASTPGIEDLEMRVWSGDKGLVYEDYAPYGVIAAITPSTHPIPVLFNSIVIITSPGNSVVFNVHPAGKKVSAYAMEIFDRVIQKNGGPANLISMIKEPTMESADVIFRHPAIRIIVATGGPALVKAAFGSGKKVIAAGPGNPPVLVDETACLKTAAKSIIEGASFDNNIICIAEKEAFVVESVYEEFMEAMTEAGAARLSNAQIDKLASKVFRKEADGHYSINKDFVGKNANVLARAVGLHLSDDVRILFGAASMSCPFVHEEQMMPYLPVVKVKCVDEGIQFALKAEHGYGHTAMIHSNNLNTITKYTKAMNTSIVVVNGPSLAGLGGMTGEGNFSHTVSSPTGEGVCTPRNFARVRRVAVSKSMQIV